MLGIEEDVGRYANVSADLPQQDRGNIASCVHRDRGPSTVSVPELLVRSALTNLDKAKSLETRYDLTCLEDRQRTQFRPRVRFVYLRTRLPGEARRLQEAWRQLPSG